jgi:integrase
MAGQRLTQARIEKLRPAEKRYQVPDPECPGLYVRITPAGSKTFTIVARDPTGRQVWRGVKGAIVGDPLDDVRARAREGLRRLKAGQDPFPPALPPADTFGAVVDNFLVLHVEANGLRSRPEIERCLNKYVLPLWRGREFEDIRRSDVTRLLDGIVKDHGARQADYVLAIVRGVMNWQASRLDDYVSPIVRRMARSKPAERKRERILSDDELRTLWPLLGDCGGFGALLKLLLLSGQRREKVASMRWADVSIDGVWSIPAEAREKGNARELALPALALDAVRAQPRISGNEYIFAGRTGGCFRGFSKPKGALDKKAGIAPWVLHDLRRTARSLMSRAGVRPDVAERVLGHVIAGVEGVYDRHQYSAEKADALARLAALVERILDPPAENVVELAGRA